MDTYQLRPRVTPIWSSESACGAKNCCPSAPFMVFHTAPSIMSFNLPFLRLRVCHAVTGHFNFARHCYSGRCKIRSHGQQGQPGARLSPLHCHGCHVIPPLIISHHCSLFPCDFPCPSIPFHRFSSLASPIICMPYWVGFSPMLSLSGCQI